MSHPPASITSPAAPRPAASARRKRVRRLLLILAVAIGSTALVLVTEFAAPALSQRFELAAFDRWMWLTRDRHPLSDNVALVVIDEGSLEHMATLKASKRSKWPWPLEFHEALLAWLHAAGAKEVKVDLLFLEPNDELEEAQMSTLVEAMGNVSFAHIGGAEGKATRFTPNFAADMVDEDIARTYRPTGQFLVWPGTFHDVFIKTDAAISADHLVVEGAKILEQYLPPDANDRLDPAKVRAALAKAPPPAGAERVRGKTVFIGSNAAGVHDLKATPMGNLQPAVMLHIVAASNAATGVRLDPVSAWWRGFFVFAASLAVASLVTLLTRLRAQVAGSIFVIGLVGAISYLAFTCGLWIPPVGAAVAASTAFAVAMTVQARTEGLRRKRISQMFSSFVSPRVLAKMMESDQDPQLGGLKFECSVFFSDLVGFTDLSERLSPEGVVEAINDYFTQTSGYVLDADGYLDKYIGDAMMSVFGAPYELQDHAKRACLAALGCLTRLREIAPEIERRHGAKLDARFGVHTGEMVAGLMGSPSKMSYTVIGDAVNLASRLEGANKPYGTSIMISEATRRQAAEAIETRPIDYLAVKGKKQGIAVHELLAVKGALTPAQSEARDLVTTAFADYLARRFEEAGKGYARARELLGGHDGLCELYLERIAAYLREPPPEDWDGVYRMKTK